MGKGVTYLNPPSVPPAGMFSHVAIAEPGGRIAYIAGQTAVDMQGHPVSPHAISGQIPVVFDHIGRILKELGADWSDILQFTTYLVGPEQRQAWQAGRVELFAAIYPEKKYPPNTLLIVQGLARPEYLLEISAIVRLP